MKKLVKGLFGMGTIALMGASQAFATDLPKAPEIDVGQGLAAIAILFCVAVVVREKFLRETSAKA